MLKTRSKPNERVLGAIENLGRLVELYQKRRGQVAREAGLTVGQWQVLEEIAGENFIPSLFARRRESSPAAVSKTLRHLLDKGLVQTAISPEDGRQREYTLTPKGRKALEQTQASRERAIQAIWENLPAEEVGRFREITARILRRLEQYADEEETRAKREGRRD